MPIAETGSLSEGIATDNANFTNPELSENEYDEYSIMGLTSSVTRILRDTEDRLKEQDKEDNIHLSCRRSLTFDANIVNMFARYVYHQRQLEGNLNIEYLEAGADTSMENLQFHRQKPRYIAAIPPVYKGEDTEQRKIAKAKREEFFLKQIKEQEEIDRVANAEIEVLYIIAMWNMTNEIYKQLRIEGVTAEEFKDMITESALREVEASGTEERKYAGERYLAHMCNSPDNEQRYFSKVGATEYHPTYIPDIAEFVQKIADDLNKGVWELSEEDIPYMIASYTRRAIENIVNPPFNNVEDKEKLDFAIKHAIAMYKYEKINTAAYLQMVERRIQCPNYKGWNIGRGKSKINQPKLSLYRQIF